MYYSQNGYSVIDTQNECKNFAVDDFSLPLRPDDCGYLLARFANDFDSRIEELGKTETFGWNHRRISGSDDWSNHASGTAIDLNSSRHPHGATKTFGNNEAELRDLLDDYDSVIKWGGDYRFTKDEMHFEIDRPLAAVRLLAAALRRNNKVYVSKLQPGKRNLDVHMVKRALAKRGFYEGSMSKYFGKGLRTAYANWQRALGYTGVDADGIPGPTSLRALGFRVV